MTALEAAQADKAFQCFLARCFGTRYISKEGTMALVMYRWRDVTYITQQLTNLPHSPPTFGPG